MLKKNSPHIHPTAIISEEVQLADDVLVGPFSIIEGPVKIGKSTKIHSHVVIKGDTHIGQGSEIFPFSTLGDKPIHLRHPGKNAQLRIGKNALIREHCSIHRGCEADENITEIGDNLVMMCSSHIAHDCRVGNNVMLSVHTILGGHVHVEDFVSFGGKVSITPFIRIGEYAFVKPHNVISGKNILPFAFVSNNESSFYLNKRGLQRHDFLQQDILKLHKAFQILNHKDTMFKQRLQELDALKENPHIAKILSFMKKESKFGYHKYFYN